MFDPSNYPSQRKASALLRIYLWVTAHGRLA